MDIYIEGTEFSIYGCNKNMSELRELRIPYQEYMCLLFLMQSAFAQISIDQNSAEGSDDEGRKRTLKYFSQELNRPVIIAEDLPDGEAFMENLEFTDLHIPHSSTAGIPNESLQIISEFLSEFISGCDEKQITIVHSIQIDAISVEEDKMVLKRGTLLDLLELIENVDSLILGGVSFPTNQLSFDESYDQLTKEVYAKGGAREELPRF